MKKNERKRRQTARRQQPDENPIDSCLLPAVHEPEEDQGKYRWVPLESVGEGAPNACGDAFIGINNGKIIIAGFALPDPWKQVGRIYTSYSAFLEVPESGDRIRVDMIRASNDNWIALKALDISLQDYRRIFICPVADGAMGESVLQGDLRT